MSELLETSAIGRDLERIEGAAKVRGAAPYAYEHPVQHPAYLYPVQATIARGRMSGVDTAAAEALDGVLAVLTHENAPRLADTSDHELAVLQSDAVGFRGQYVAAVVAETPEIAREAADLVRISYETEDADTRWRTDHPERYTPAKEAVGGPADTDEGDVAAALARADVVIDETYTTPQEHNNPMEPHTSVTVWDGEMLTLYESSQGTHPARKQLAPVFGLELEQLRIISPHVGGGFGSKGLPHANAVLAGLAAMALPGRAVKYALSRRQMFSIAGYRSPTSQHVRLGADREGRLTAVSMDVVVQTSNVKEFVEHAAVPARMMYAGENRHTSHRVVPLDVAVPSWMRAPGECPGMFGPEVAMDELAVACGLDPIELRVRNEPGTDPQTGKPFNNRRLVDCLREGARRFGWADRDPAPRSRREDGWLIGSGVAAATYPANRQPGSTAWIGCGPGGEYIVEIGAADLGTGTWTALTQIAADALEVPVEKVKLQIGDTALPMATVAGGSTGIASWGAAIIAAADQFRKENGEDPEPGDSAEASAERNPHSKRVAMHSFGAQFAEVRVHEDTGEIRLSRMLGVFSAGRIINPRTARSQFIGGMTMGVGMALHEEGVVDPRFGHVVNHDLAEYHVPTNADITDMDAFWLDEADPYAGPLGARGIGEIGIVGAAAAVANAAYHATGIRVRDLPLLSGSFL